MREHENQSLVTYEQIWMLEIFNNFINLFRTLNTQITFMMNTHFVKRTFTEFLWLIKFLYLRT